MKRKNNSNQNFLILFLVSTLFFCIYHYLTKGWDFSAYALNAKYWLGSEQYFELYRSPLMQFALLILGAGLFAEYAFVIIASSIFAYTCHYFAKQTKLDPLLFYAFMLNPFTLLWGLSEGTEMLSLITLTLGVSFILAERSSGLLFGLTFLSRYTNLYYTPLLLFEKRKNWIKSIILFALVVAPWFIYNRIAHSNYFASIANSYALNVKFRDYMDFMWGFEHFTWLIWLAPFAAYGIYRKFKLSKTKNSKLIDQVKSLEKIDWIMITFILISLYTYFTTPFKVERYIFNLILPLSYYSAYGLNKVISKKNIMIISLLVIIVSFSYGLAHVQNYKFDSQSAHKIINAAEELNVSQCIFKSDNWVHINYYSDMNAAPIVSENDIAHHSKMGYIVAFNRNVSGPNKIYDKNGISLFGNPNNCIKEYPMDQSYLERYKSDIIKKYNYTEEIESCFIIFNDGLLEELCKKINFY